MNKVRLILVLLPVFCFGQWNQIGSDVDGQTANEESGAAVSMNATGTAMIIGAPRAFDNGIRTGKARVFQWDGTAWQQQGSDLAGTVAEDFFGNAVSMSEDGTVVAVGAPGFNNPAFPPGYSRIYAWNGTDWIQRGTDIIGEGNGNRAGAAISLSANGNTIAIGANSNNGANGSASGHCRVYEWNGTTWVQKGADIDGEAQNDFFGGSVSLDASGTIVAVGAAGHDGGGNGFGQVRVFEWNGNNWIQKGSDVYGDPLVNGIGNEMSLSDDGNSFISSGHTGTNGSIGSIKVHRWNGTNWEQQGGILSGTDGSDFFGTSVDINADGSMIVAGTTGSGIIPGYARVFSLVDGAWVQQGTDLIGEANGDQFGRAASMSSSGTIVAVGTRFNDGNGSNSGHVRVYQNTLLSTPNFDRFSFSFYPNPSQDVVNFSSDVRIENVTLFNLLGQEVVFKEVNASEFVLDMKNLSSGTYFGKLYLNGRSQSFKLIKI